MTISNRKTRTSLVLGESDLALTSTHCTNSNSSQLEQMIKSF